MSLSDEVPHALEGQRLDRVVSLIASCSRTEASRWIAQGRVSVDGEVADKGSLRLAVGVRIRVDVPESLESRVEADANVEFAVVFADEHVIVVDKPAGLVVHPGSGHPDGTLVNGLVARFPDLADVGEPQRPGIVHRLDRGTSGLMVVARTSHAYRTLVADLSDRVVERGYSALVHGHPEAARGVVDAPVGRSPRDATRMAVVSGGKPARTRYEVDATFDEPVKAALVHCKLETGRTHQIRVHLAAIGHPVVGDTRYGGSGSVLKITRPFLHARVLEFTHPTTAEPMAFTAALPTDLATVLARLGS